MKAEPDKKLEEQLLALAAMVDYVTKQPVIDKSELKEVDRRVDLLLANMNRNRSFFKRLA